MFDMTNDGIPELHVLTDISYSVHTVEGKKLHGMKGIGIEDPLIIKLYLEKQNQVKHIMNILF